MYDGLASSRVGRIVYFHLCLGSNEESMSLLASVAKKAESESDGLILDLRDGRAVLVGSKTKGYFLADRIYEVIPGKYDLYLAAEKTAFPAPDLEGVGVTPDIEVASDLPYSYSTLS